MTNSRHVTPRRIEGRVWQLFDSHKREEALAACEALNRAFPDYASGWHTASQLAQRLNRRAAALNAIEHAVALEPDNPEWRLQKAYCLMQLGRTPEARPILMALAGKQFESAHWNATVALLLSRLGEQDRAEWHYRQAAVIDPGESQHLYNLATVQRFQGKLNEAEDSLDRALAVNPHDYEAHKLRADLRTQSPESNHIEALEQLLADGINDPKGRVEILYALAKEREDTGDFEASFAALTQASQQRRQMMQYSPEADIATMKSIAQHFDAVWDERTPAGLSSEQPIFILGLPRTGSTLLEHSLAAHSRVDSAGELNNFAIEMVRLARARLAPGQQVDKQAMVGLSARLDFAELGTRYLESLPPAPSGVRHIIDKMPLNFLYTGLIHKALPRAKMIHIQRSPMDACYAIYKTSFRDAYPFSYDLEELGNYYVAYRELMAHWESQLGDSLCSVSYENLVSDTDGEIRRLLAFCGLEFEAACLAPQDSSLASTTASASQVRNPVYRTSVDKWQRYRRQLEPLAIQLKEAGIDVGA